MKINLVCIYDSKKYKSDGNAFLVNTPTWLVFDKKGGSVR